MPKNFLPVNRENLRSPGRAPSIAKTLWAVMRPESLICLQEKPFLNHSRRDANLFKGLLRKGVLDSLLLYRNPREMGRQFKSAYM